MKNETEKCGPVAFGEEESKIRQILREVMDPEIPVLSIMDLGIVRGIEVLSAPAGEGWEGIVTITPTYSGCPAMEAIRTDIRLRLLEHGYKNIVIRESLSPPWTTDWMTEEGKEKLKSYGIAPPNPRQQFCNIKEFFEEESVQCPHCHSYRTEAVSRFGSTACKALYRCRACGEVFDYFKCH